MAVSLYGRVLGAICLMLALAFLAGALLWSRYALPWQGSSLARRAASRCSVPAGFTYHVEVTALDNMPILAVRCLAFAYLTPAHWSQMQRMEAEGLLNTSPRVPAGILSLLASHTGWYVVEQRLLIDSRDLSARPAGMTAVPLGGH